MPNALGWRLGHSNGTPLPGNESSSLCSDFATLSANCGLVQCSKNQCSSITLSAVTMRAGRRPSCAIRFWARTRRSSRTRASTGSTAGCENLPQSCDRARLAGQLQNVHAGIGPVHHVDVAAVVGLDIVALDRGLAALLSVDLDAALVGCLGDGRYEVADLLRVEGIPDVDGAHPGVEPGRKRKLLIQHRRHALVR